MSFFAVALTVCMQSGDCESYNVDHSFDTESECTIELDKQWSGFKSVYMDTTSVKPLRDWLEAQQIFIEPAYVTGAAMSCEEFDDVEESTIEVDSKVQQMVADA